MRLRSVNRIIIEPYVICSDFVWTFHYESMANITYETISRKIQDFFGFHIAVIQDEIELS